MFGGNIPPIPISEGGRNEYYSDENTDNDKEIRKRQQIEEDQIIQIFKMWADIQ